MQHLCDAQNDIQKIDFGPILTPKRVILAPILRFRGQITKITPEMDSLTQKNICVDGSHLNFKPVDFILSFLKKSIFCSKSYFGTLRRNPIYINFVKTFL